MKKVYIKKLAGAGVLSIGLVFGMAGFAGATSGTIDTTGPNSENEIEFESRVEVEVENRNDLDLRNRNQQRASSGDSRVRYNTTGGSASTGDAANDNMVDAWVEIDNSQAAADLSGAVGGQASHSASIANTGPDSENEVEFESRTEVEVENRNYVDINNSVEQSARSGDATVRYNTTGGDATSGNVSNTSSSVFTVSITN